MINLLQQSLLDIASISSILGLLISIFILFKAREIHKSFLRRARLPAITRELAKTTSEISTKLKSWSKSKQPALDKLAKAKGLLENLKPKLPNDEEKQINNFLKNLHPTKFLFIKASLNKLTEDTAWSLYTDLGTIVTRLEELVKDSKWD